MTHLYVHMRQVEIILCPGLTFSGSAAVDAAKLTFRSQDFPLAIILEPQPQF